MATDNKVVATVPPPNGFSLQINQALHLLSSKFGDEINEAYMTAPATKNRAKETEDQILENKRVVEDNQKAIMVDMRILEKSKSIGQSSKDVVGKFLGFEHLGESDYLDFLDDDDDSDYDSSDADADEESDDDEDIDEDNITIAMSMKDESMRLAGTTQVAGGGNSDDEGDDDSDDDDSDYSDSDFDDSDSEYDEGDDSSIGSYGDLMADLEKSMGVDIPSGLRVQGAMHGSTMSLCSLSSSVQANDE